MAEIFSTPFINTVDLEQMEDAFKQIFNKQLAIYQSFYLDDKIIWLLDKAIQYHLAETMHVWGGLQINE